MVLATCRCDPRPGRQPCGGRRTRERMELFLGPNEVGTTIVTYIIGGGK
jgi:hypothetical protein